MGGFGGGSFGGSGFMDGGGGFMPNMSEGINDTSVESKDKKLDKERQSVIPITIKQLLSASWENDPSSKTLRIDGIETKHVRILGMISKINHQSTTMSYEVNDGTGTIECKQFIESDGGLKNDKLRVGDYAKIHGVLKEFGGVKSIQIYGVTPLDESNSRMITNESTCHFLEVIYIHLQHTRGPIKSVPDAARSPQPFAVGSVPMQTSQTPQGANFHSLNRGIGGTSLSGNRGAGPSISDSDKVYEAFCLALASSMRDSSDKELKYNTGVTCDQAYRLLKNSSMDYMVFVNVARALGDGGQLWSTEMDTYQGEVFSVVNRGDIPI